MGIVWETYHKRVPLLGVPAMTLDEMYETCDPEQAQIHPQLAAKKKPLKTDRLPTKVTFFPWKGHLWVQTRWKPLKNHGTFTIFLGCVYWCLLSTRLSRRHPLAFWPPTSWNISGGRESPKLDTYKGGPLLVIDGIVTPTWMSQEVRINGWYIGYNLLINGVYWGYNPLTNHVLTSRDIQV